MRRALMLLVLAASVAAILVATAAAASAPTTGPRRTPVRMRSTARIACAPVYWRTERDGDQRCPSSHSVLAEISYTDLHWTMWTRTQADGYGDVLALDAVPGPRPGSTVQAFEIKLTHVRHCSDGRWI